MTTTFSNRLDAILNSMDHRGCTADEVSRLESEFQVILPDDYKYFLEKCGRKLDGYLVGTDWHYGELHDNQVAARELLQEVNAPEMPKGSLAFSMHQGYSFFYLNNEGVFFYLEGRKQSERQFESFAEFFESTCHSQGIDF